MRNKTLVINVRVTPEEKEATAKRKILRAQRIRISAKIRAW